MHTYPTPEYQLGLTLVLEKFCEYLDGVSDIGIVFGDYEKDEITRSVLDFSQLKISGNQHMHFGRPLGRLIDTIYFTHSHHSRFLQVSDVLMYLANRCENGVHTKNAWHDKEIGKIWEETKKNTDYRLDRWPK